MIARPAAGDAPKGPRSELKAPLTWLFCMSALLARQSLAAELYEANQLDALHFRPAAGVSDVGVSVQINTPDSQHSFDSAVQTARISRDYLEAGLSYNFGISDLLQIGVGENYLFDHLATNTNSKTGVATTTNSTGLSDPTLSVNGRVYGGLTGRRFANVYGSVTPALADAKSPSGSQRGNNLAGSTTSAVGGSFFWVEGGSEVQLKADVTSHAAGSSTPQGAATANTTKAYWSFDLAAYYRCHFSADYFLQPGLLVNAPVTTSTTNANANPVSHTTSHESTRLVPSLALGALIEANLLSSLSYTYTSYTQTARSTAGSNAHNYSYDIQQGNLKVALSYLF